MVVNAVSCQIYKSAASKVPNTRSFSINTYSESVLLQICSLNRFYLAVLCFSLGFNLNGFNSNSKTRVNEGE